MDISKYENVILEKEKYKKLEKEIKEKLSNRCYIPRYFSDKIIFRRLELITTLEIEEITKLLNPLDLSKTQNIYTLLYLYEDDCFEINITKTDFMTYHCYCFTKSFENIYKVFDIIAKDWDFSLKENGLFYTNSYESEKLNTFISSEKITSSPIEIISFFGIDYMFFNQYFQDDGECNLDKEKFYDYIYSSCLFDSSFFHTHYKCNEESIYNIFREEYLKNKEIKKNDMDKKINFQNAVLKRYELYDPVNIIKKEISKDLILIEKISLLKGKELKDFIDYVINESKYLGKKYTLKISEKQKINEIRRVLKDYETSSFELI